MNKKNFINFAIITFLWSVFVSMLKFFLRSYLKEANISLEEIAGYLSLGTILAYFFGGPIAYAFRKKSITLIAGLSSIICLAIGNMVDYHPLRIFITIITIIGYSYGLRLIVKSILLSIEIKSSNKGEAKINGIINSAILLGILAGSYLGFSAFERRGPKGFQSIIAILGIASIFTMFLDYDQHFHKIPIKNSLQRTIPNIITIIKKYIRLLVPIGALRAISTAIGQKMLEIGVDYFQRTTTSSIIIIVMSFVGAIIGHLISAFFKRKRKFIAMIFTMILGISTIYFPHIINKFEYFITLNIFGFLMGIFFGIAVNLLEGRYFFHIGDDQKKEYGSTTYGILINTIIFVIMIAADIFSEYAGAKTIFFVFGFILLLMPFFIRKFDASNLSDIKQ